MLSELGEDALKFEDIYLDSMNREQAEYRLDREMTETLGGQIWTLPRRQTGDFPVCKR